MNPTQYRSIVNRAFMATGRDGGAGLVYYIDQLERAFLYMDKEQTQRKTVRRRTQLHEALDYHAKRLQR